MKITANNSETVAVPPFKNVEVTAIPEVSPNGQVTYKLSFAPPKLHIKDPDTVINYQLVGKTPADVRFTGLTIEPTGTDQFSHAAVSQSGKMITLSDANTLRNTFKVKLAFSNKEALLVMTETEPEIENEPTPHLPEGDTASLMSMPEIENEPTPH
jgi:hypothetical protein